MVKIAEFRLNKYNSLIINLAALTNLAIVTALLWILKGKDEILFYLEQLYYNGQILSLVLTLLAVVILHEAIHGLVYLVFGAKLKFGINQLNIYTMDVSGNLYTTYQMAIIMLLPFFALTGLLIIAAMLFSRLSLCMWIGIICNICGSTGDILLLTYILYNRIISKGKSLRIRDEEHGFGIYTQ